MSNRKILIFILILATFLRLWRLDGVPVSLFGDELDVGYHAYSILKTGRDYSGNFMPIHFQSLAEWRTPLYLYSAVPTVAIFGISPWGVRLPAAIFGILGIWFFYLLIREFTKKESIALLAAFFLAISPWHIEYSRAGFEVTEMLALYLAGIYFFLLGLRDYKKLPFAALSLGLTPWVYSTAKLFLPLTVLALLIIWWKEIRKVPRRKIFLTFVTFCLVVFPIAYSTLLGGGATRFNYISVFSDPTTIPEVGFARLRDAKMRDLNVTFGVQPQLLDRILHNKIVWWADILGRNYLQSFSSQFLFINGDLNPRHSGGMSELYRIDAIFLLLGLGLFLLKPFDRKIKYFVFFWLLASPIPAMLTRDGGMHATRLFFLLPMLVLLVSIGVYYSAEFFKNQKRKIFVFSYSALFLSAFMFYQHNYWVHYPWDSERWWHDGFAKAVKEIKKIDNKYDRVIMSSSGEPPWIFFAGGYEYPPEKWHQGYPMKKTIVPGFGEISYIDKFYFGSIGEAGIYGLGNYIDDKTLYLSVAKEIGANLILEPQRTPSDLTLVEAIPYSSGEPAYYLFTKKTSAK